MDGIVGIYGPHDRELVNKAFLATGACQHRGKASTGIAVGSHKGIYVHKDLGRIAEVIDSRLVKIFQDLSPQAVIGNIGYTKNIVPEKVNIEPIEIAPCSGSDYQVVITMDGYLVGEEELYHELSEEYNFQTSNFTEIVGALLHKYISEEGITFAAGERLVQKLDGRATFALAALVYDNKETHLVTLNDANAFEPFCYGVSNSTFIASSESCSHRRLGSDIYKEYDGAEMSICNSSGIETRRVKVTQMNPDVFQAVYFGNVASVFRGKEIFQIRRELGHKLVESYSDSSADIVIPNPESGWGVSVGLAEGLKKNLYPALIKLPQAIRTFQEGRGLTRTKEVGLKFGGIDSILGGKRIAMGDDSIVRGSVSEGGSVWVVYNAGAKYIEFWISYGAMFFPSFKEWHRGTKCLDELAAQRAFKNDNPYDKSLDEINKAIAKLVGVDEVRYNTLPGIREVTGSGSFQALDASYPISEKYWPDFIKTEVEKFKRYR
ncbi:MAG: hypothetical protein GX846_04435 [Deltaproteobacteria bacterium]|nr:hypothetical protein [Deltaproteobacteria bacterium]